MTPTTYTLEATGEETKIEAIIELLRPVRHPGSGAHGQGGHRAGPKTRAAKVEEQLGKPPAPRGARRARIRRVVGFAD